MKSELNKGSKFSFWLPIRHKAEISQAFSTEANFEYRKNDTPYKSLITDKLNKKCLIADKLNKKEELIGQAGKLLDEAFVLQD